MLYLLTLGWPWFAAAAALGVAIGFLTATRTREGELSGRWVILLAVVALAAAGAAAWEGVVPGRNGLMLEIGFLASLAYFLGLPLGGGVKGLMPAKAAAPEKPRPVIVRGAMQPPPAPVAKEPAPAMEKEKPVAAAPEVGVAEAPLAVTHEVGLVAPAPAPAVTNEVRLDAAPASAPKSAKIVRRAAGSGDGKGLPGRPPQALSGPRGETPDDLTRIKGVGPKSAKKLHGLGVYHFDQIASWTIDEARYVSAALGIPGRVEKGKWVQQARQLQASKDGRNEAP